MMRYEISSIIRWGIARCVIPVTLVMAVMLPGACSNSSAPEYDSRIYWFNRRELRRSNVAIVPCIFTDKAAKVHWPRGLMAELMQPYITRGGHVWSQQETFDAMGADGIAMMDLIAPEFASAKQFNEDALGILVSSIRKKLPADYICLVEVKLLQATVSEKTETETEVTVTYGRHGERIEEEKEEEMTTRTEEGKARICLAFVRTSDLSIAWVVQATGKWSKEFGYGSDTLAGEIMAPIVVDAVSDIVWRVCEGLFRKPGGTPSDISIDRHGRTVKATFIGIMKELPKRSGKPK